MRFYNNEYKADSVARDLTGPQKAAIVMVAMGGPSSAEVLKHLGEDDIEFLTTEITRLDNVSMEVRESVLEEFSTLVMAYQYVTRGGVDYARRMLDKALGARKSKEIMSRVMQKVRVTGFNLLDDVDPGQLVNFMRKEHPQTIALLLVHMESASAASILSGLPQEMQVDVAFRMATIERVSLDTLDLVEEVLVDQIKSLFDTSIKEVGGVQSVAELLNNVDRTTEKNILENLERENPDLASEIKNLMFVFEDILLLDDVTMRRVLKDIDSKDLPTALKGASEELLAKFLQNMSNRAGEMLSEEISFLGPVRLKDVEDVQQRIVDVVRRLEEEGQIFIRGHDNDMIA